MASKNSNKKDKESSLLSGIYSPKRKELIMKRPETLTVGQRLRRERYLRKWSLEKMAAYLGISTSYLGALERGERSLSASVESKIHRLLHLSYDFLHVGITLSGEAISQYVHESVNYSTKHNVDVLLGVCTEEELESCYELIHTFLINRRKRVYNPSPSYPGRTEPRQTSPLPEREAAREDISLKNPTKAFPDTPKGA